MPRLPLRAFIFSPLPLYARYDVTNTLTYDAPASLILFISCHADTLLLFNAPLDVTRAFGLCRCRLMFRHADAMLRCHAAIA